MSPSARNAPLGDPATTMDVDPMAPDVMSSRRLDQIVRQNGTIEDRTLETWLPDSSLNAYPLGFG